MPLKCVKVFWEYILNPEIVRMLLGEIEGPITVGRLSTAAAIILEAKSSWVWLSKETLVKQLTKHPELSLSDYVDMSWVLQTGEIVKDRQVNRLHFLASTHFHKKPRMHKVTVKVAKNSERAFLISAHWVRPRSAEKLKRLATGQSFKK